MTPILVAALLVSTAAGIDAHEAPLGEPDVDRVQGLSVPIELCRGFLIRVHGQVGDIADLHLLLDTGTARSIVDARLAERLAWPAAPSRLLGFRASAAAEDTVVPSIRIGPLHRMNVRALSADLTRVSASLGCPFDAIIGADLLRDACFVIDYRARTLAFECRGGWDAHVEFDPDSPYLVVETLIDGTRLRLIADTGAEVIAVFNRATPAGWDARVCTEVDAIAVTGGLRLRQLVAGSIDAGVGRWHGRPVFIVSGDGPDPSYDGVLGIRALGLRAVQFDLVRSRLSWRD